ncbi:MAG: neutral zinc metallopeptidase [Flavobacteriales bacterium]|nr:neutral zinc metallopeptidase [Flavobacteriales bacterium]
MKWKGRQGSSNVQDVRGSGGKKAMGGLGLGGIVILIIYVLLGGDPQQALDSGAMGGGTQQSEYVESAEEKELAQMVSVVLKETEDVWHKLFREQLGKSYVEPTLVLFSGQVTSACGNASAATGPFYCSGDNKLYIDLSFYNELKTRFKALGDFAMAYVVAHEVAHHVQNLQGITGAVHRQRSSLDEKSYNKLSVRLELQADFYAGVWAHYANSIGLLEDGDIEEALNAAFQIGDDRIQMMGRGYVVPDSFTHGTSEQRMRWFKKGYQTGEIAQGDTFSASSL